MTTRGFIRIAAVVVAIHVAALGFAMGRLHWKYLLVTVISGVVIWCMVPTQFQQRGWAGWLVRCVVALAVQWAAFRFWREQLGGMWPSMAQFAALHFLIGIGISKLPRDRRLMRT